MHSTRNARGFTLVELLVVIGIIALLAGILMPTLSRTRRSAMAVQCANNMRVIGQAMQMYALENDGTIVPAGVNHMTDIHNKNIAGSWVQSWDVTLKPYLTRQFGKYHKTTPHAVDYEVIPYMQCPADDIVRTMSVRVINGGFDNHRSYAMVASQPRYPQDGLSYPPILGTGMVTNVVASHGRLPGLYPGFHYLKFAAVKQPGETILLAELISSGNVLGNANYNQYGASGSVLKFPFQQVQYLPHYKPIHDGKFNYLMCDGSVQRLAPPETMRGHAAEDGVWNKPPEGQFRLNTSTGFANYMWTIRTDD